MLRSCLRIIILIVPLSESVLMSDDEYLDSKLWVNHVLR